MTETIEVLFPGGKRVDAKIDKMIVHTDQPIKISAFHDEKGAVT
jgi:hypothetical protein